MSRRSEVGQPGVSLQGSTSTVAYWPRTRSGRQLSLLLWETLAPSHPILNECLIDDGMDGTTVPPFSSRPREIINREKLESHFQTRQGGVRGLTCFAQGCSRCGREVHRQRVNKKDTVLVTGKYTTTMRYTNFKSKGKKNWYCNWYWYCASTVVRSRIFSSSCTLYELRKCRMYYSTGPRAMGSSLAP